MMAVSVRWRGPVAAFLSGLLVLLGIVSHQFGAGYGIMLVASVWFAGWGIAGSVVVFALLPMYLNSSGGRPVASMMAGNILCFLVGVAVLLWTVTRWNIQLSGGRTLPCILSLTKVLFLALVAKQLAVFIFSYSMNPRFLDSINLYIGPRVKADLGSLIVALLLLCVATRFVEGAGLLVPHRWGSLSAPRRGLADVKAPSSTLNLSEIGDGRMDQPGFVVNAWGRLALYGAVGLTAICVLFPPFFVPAGGMTQYGFLLSGPPIYQQAVALGGREAASMYSYNLDLMRLLIELGLVWGLFFALKRTVLR